MVLAAGLGTRLRPLTNSIPKPLLPIGGQPLIVWNLKLLERHGITQVMINVHHLGDQIREALGDGRAWGLEISYSPEPMLLGTGGGLKQVEAFFQGEPFIVLNGDTLADLSLTDMVERFRSQGGIGLMALRDVPDPDRWGPVETDVHERVLTINGRGQRIESSDMVAHRRMFAGIHVLDPLLLKNIPVGRPSSIIDAYVEWIGRGAGVYGYVFSGYWSDVGTPERYAEAQRDADRGLRGVSGASGLAQR